MRVTDYQKELTLGFTVERKGYELDLVFSSLNDINYNAKMCLVKWLNEFRTKIQDVQS